VQWMNPPASSAGPTSAAELPATYEACMNWRRWSAADQGEEQQAVVELSADVQIVEPTAEAGMRRTDASAPAASRRGRGTVRRIGGLGLRCTMYLFSRWIADDVKQAVGCGLTRA
jgi:hypothetical protein